MPLPINRPIYAAIEGRRGQLERAQSMQGRRHRVTGFVEIVGAGESLAEVVFPVHFIEVPMVSFGGELGPNEVLEDRHFPTISVMVRAWKREERAGAEYITGATLIIVTTGRVEQRATAHWQAEGTALVPPLLSSGSVDEPI